MKNLLLIGALMCAPVLFGQGEDCDQATYLPDITDFCSANGFYTNANSTPSGLGTAACWPVAATSDVWFTFIATGTELLGSVAGSGFGGTMTNPRIALYTGSCSGTMTEVACSSGSGSVQIYEAAMTPGLTYYLRVSTTTANRGTFRLCLNNYTSSSNPGSDCSGAAKLCDKNTVSVATFNGSGSDPYEPDVSGSCMTIENNSVWYKWTCQTTGPLTFDITPINGTNDIDFVLFEIPDIDDCDNKTVLRCNTASCTPGTGSTGLNATDPDISEDPGCDFGENAYCSQVTMTAGTSYLLVIDNANAFDGFNLSFGGTATFGPNPVISPVNTPICQGESIVFDGSTSTAVDGGLTWTFSDGTTITNETGAGPFNITYPDAGNYIAILEGVDSDGCESSQSVDITVGLPGLSAGADQTVCLGASVTLLGSGATSYSWDNGVQNGVAFTPSSTQTYTVTGTSNGCTGTDEIVVNVTSGGSASAGADQAVCAGQSVTLSGSGAATYTWNNGVTNGVAFTPTSTQTYTMTGTTSGGCQNTDEVVVTVNPLPTVSAGTDQSVCVGEGATLSGSGAVSYSWDNGVSNDMEFSPAATQTYTVTGTDENNCQNTDQVIVTVNPLPLVDGGSDQTVCSGTPVMLSGSGASSYSWSDGVQDGVSFTPSSTVTYTVTGTNGNGCVNTATVTVNVIPQPVAAISGGPFMGIPGLMVNLANASTNGVNYYWSFGNGQTATTTDITDTYTIAYNAVGSYLVSLIAENGMCSDTAYQDVIITLPPAIVHDIPNVFTPNGDGENDLFNLIVENAVSINITVINRWGSAITEFDGIVKSWDGKADGGEEASEGVYFFTYDVLGVDGNHTTGEAFVQLFR